MFKSLSGPTAATRRRSERGDATHEKIIGQSNALRAHLYGQAAFGLGQSFVRLQTFV